MGYEAKGYETNFVTFLYHSVNIILFTRLVHRSSCTYHFTTIPVFTVAVCHFLAV